MRPTLPGQSAPPPGDEDGWNDGGVGPAASVRIASVSPDGRFVSLSFRGGASAEDGGGPPAVTTVRLHAAWLWSNDPSRVTLPSGQRTSTPGDWTASGRPAVAGAEVIRCPIGAPPSSSDIGDGGTACVVPGPPPGDCCHPLAVYGEHLPWIVTRRSGPGDGGRAYLRVTWTSPSDGDGPSSTYDAEWLLRCCCPGDDGGVPRAETEVTPAHAVRRDGPPEWHGSDGASEESDGLFGDGVRLERGDDGLARIDYASVVDCGGTPDGSDGLFRLLHSVFRDGAAIVTNAPHSAETDGEIPGVCESVASMSESELPAGRVGRAMSGTGGLSHGALYGNVFHVRVGERGSNNVAYTSDGLCPHQDLAYYESPPGVQILHCAAVGSKVRGGESILIDAMAAAHRLREVRRGSFECLLECPATFVKQRDGACMTYRRPHIALERSGASSPSDGTPSRSDGEIVSVFWSPPFEGPARLPADSVGRYYEAYADFERMLGGGDAAGPDGADGGGGGDELSGYAREYTWRYKLRPGEMLVFNNRRMLHGRRSFSSGPDASSEEGQRHLVGCYTNIDDTLNNYRVLLRSRAANATILNPGNGSRVLP